MICFSFLGETTIESETEIRNPQDWRLAKLAHKLGGCKNISPMDIDSLVERNHHFLIDETKNHTKELKRGQRIALERLVEMKVFTLIISNSKRFHDVTKAKIWSFDPMVMSWAGDFINKDYYQPFSGLDNIEFRRKWTISANLYPRLLHKESFNDLIWKNESSCKHQKICNKLGKCVFYDVNNLPLIKKGPFDA